MTATNENESAISAHGSPFGCPTTRSKLFGARQCNLLIVINEFFERQSFDELAAHVRLVDPAVNAVVLRDEASMDVSLPPNPTLIFSPAFLRHRPPVGGRIICGFPLSKSEEYTALEKAGIPVPKWTLLEEDNIPNLSGFDDYIVKKPDYGARGAEVKIVRKDRVRWRPVKTAVAGECSSFVLQQFIYTGERPVSYRVNTLLEKCFTPSAMRSGRIARRGRGRRTWSLPVGLSSRVRKVPK